jgi:hypothetical protein
MINLHVTAEPKYLSNMKAASPVSANNEPANVIVPLEPLVGATLLRVQTADPNVVNKCKEYSKIVEAQTKRAQVNNTMNLLSIRRKNKFLS